MIPKIKSVVPLKNYELHVIFDDGKEVLYNAKEDIDSLPGYDLLKDLPGFFQQVQLDASRTCIFWNDEIDLPSDTIYEYGTLL